MDKQIDRRGEITLKKSSALIHINACELTTMQRRIVNFLYYIAKNQITESDKFTYTTTLLEMQRVTGIKETSKPRIKKAFKDLRSKDIEYNILDKDTEVWGCFSLIQDPEITFNRATNSAEITFTLPRKIRNAIKTPHIYAYIDLSIIKGLRNKYSIALYELARDYFKIKKRFFKINDIKILLGVGNKYERFSMFENRVLSPAVKDANEKTEFNISYNVQREQRKIIGIEVFFDTKETTPRLTPKQNTSNLSKSTIESLKYYGFTDEEINTIFTDEEQIKRTLAYFDHHIQKNKEQNKPVDNPKGFLIYLYNKKQGFSPYELEKIENEKEKVRLNQHLQTITAFDKFRNQYYEHKQKRIKAIKESLSNLTESQLDREQKDYVSSLDEFGMKRFKYLKGFESQDIQASFRHFYAMKHSIYKTPKEFAKQVGYKLRPDDIV